MSSLKMLLIIGKLYFSIVVFCMSCVSKYTQNNIRYLDIDRYIGVIDEELTNFTYIRRDSVT